MKPSWLILPFAAALLLLAARAAAQAPASAQPPAPALPFTLTAEVRVRAELDLRTPDTAADAATLLRTRVGLRVPVSPHARIFAQVQDARAFGEEEGGTTDASAGQLDLHQGWLEWSDSVGGRPWAFRAGRQEISFGDERLVGAAGWTNTGRSFDGARLAAGPLNLFAAQVRERDRLGPAGLDPRQNEGEDRDALFGGAYLDARRGDLYVLHERNGAGPGTEDVNRTTVGARLERAPGRGLFWDVEAAWQTGTQRRLPAAPAEPREQEVGAWFAVGRVGWAQPAGTLRQARAGLDWLSGDDDPADGRFSAFHTLYGTNHKFYGFIDVLDALPGSTGGRGLVDAYAGAAVAPLPALPVDAALHRFWLAEEAAEGRDLGWELDLTLPFTVGGLRAQAGWSTFLNGAAAPTVGLGEEGEWLNWGYVQVTVGI